MGFKNLAILIDQFVKAYPREINIYTSFHKGNVLFPDDSIYYRFTFSEDNQLREKPLLKKQFTNTKALYEAIKKDFLDEKKLISLGYSKTKIANEYNGIRLLNSKDEKLNIYFSGDTVSQYNKELESFIQIKQQDFFSYAARPIEKHIVDKMTIRPTLEDRSSVIYIFDNEEYSSSLLKKKQLGYYYRKQDEKIDEHDITTILELIIHFINHHITENPHYVYKLDQNYQTTTLQIICDSGKNIEITDSVLIDVVEKASIIDNLWKIMHQELDYMPNQKKMIKENRK